jgi:16S rRNA (cytosine1402-N4)-methyltransferase
MDSPLDMRLDNRLNVTAADLVNGLYEKELVSLFRKSDERYAKRIAEAIIKERDEKPIKTTLHLVQTIKKALPLPYKGKQTAHKSIVGTYWQKPVMRVFQSLRIAVNSELSSLQHMLPQVVDTLAPGSLFVIISFHSGEDRIIKHFFKKKESEGEIERVMKKPYRPGLEEIKSNPNARSAKLRAIRKIK